MSDPQTAPALGLWRHSFEEDGPDAQVYRPEEYAFPLARGRAALELRPDGTFVDWTIGRGDANQPVPGRWSRQPDGTVLVTRGNGSQAIVRVTQDGTLRLEERP